MLAVLETVQGGQMRWKAYFSAVDRRVKVCLSNRESDQSRVVPNLNNVLWAKPSPRQVKLYLQVQNVTHRLLEASRTQETSRNQYPEFVVSQSPHLEMAAAGARLV